MIKFLQYAFDKKSIQLFLKNLDMDKWNMEVLCMVGFGIVLERDFYRHYGPLTNITIVEISVLF